MERNIPLIFLFEHLFFTTYKNFVRSRQKKFHNPKCTQLIHLSLLRKIIERFLESKFMMMVIDERWYLKMIYFFRFICGLFGLHFMLLGFTSYHRDIYLRNPNQKLIFLKIKNKLIIIRNCYVEVIFYYYYVYNNNNNNNNFIKMIKKIIFYYIFYF